MPRAFVDHSSSVRSLIARSLPTYTYAYSLSQTPCSFSSSRCLRTIWAHLPLPLTLRHVCISSWLLLILFWLSHAYAGHPARLSFSTAQSPPLAKKFLSSVPLSGEGFFLQFVKGWRGIDNYVAHETSKHDNWRKHIHISHWHDWMWGHLGLPPTALNRSRWNSSLYKVWAIRSS